jgi:hypothetical protein
MIYPAREWWIFPYTYVSYVLYLWPFWPIAPQSLRCQEPGDGRSTLGASLQVDRQQRASEHGGLVKHDVNLMLSDIRWC